jgi:hypothetical protein
MVGFDCDACHLRRDRSIVSMSESKSDELPFPVWDATAASSAILEDS